MKEVFMLIGKRKGKMMFCRLYSTEQKAKIKKEVLEVYDAENKDKDWKYEITKERVWD